MDDHRYAARSLRRHVEGARRERLRYHRATPRAGTRPASADDLAFDTVVAASLPGTSRLPEVEGDKPARKRFKAYPIGYLHIDAAEVQTAEGKLCLYVAIDRTSKFTIIQLVMRAGRTSASAFLESVIEAIPYKIHTVPTDNGIQFTFPPRYADRPTARPPDTRRTCSTCVAARTASNTANDVDGSSIAPDHPMVGTPAGYALRSANDRAHLHDHMGHDPVKPSVEAPSALQRGDDDAVVYAGG